MSPLDFLESEEERKQYASDGRQNAVNSWDEKG
jgi:hypothetical protein